MNLPLQKERRLALVTGASSGIGWAFAQQLADRGHDLIVVGRRQDRLEELARSLPQVTVRAVVADLATDEGRERVVRLCEQEPLDLLVNNAGVSHYMPFTQLPAEKAAELLQVKVLTPTLLAHAAAPGMVGRGRGTLINVAGMLAYGAAAPAVGRATYIATLAHLVALSQALHQELSPQGVRVQVLCPGVVATEFHSRQGLDLSSVPRMSADDVVRASLKGLELGEVVCAPGVENSALLTSVEQAQLAAFAAQSPELAQRYR